MARRPSLIVAALGIVVTAALIFVGGTSPAAVRDEVVAIAADVDARLRETAAAVDARALTLSQLPRLAWAVATDENTVLDLTVDELAFRPQPGESIEIGQVSKRTGAVTYLLRLGQKDATHLPLSKPGRHVVVAGDKLLAAAVQTVVPRQRADELTGAVAVSKPVDFSPAVARLSALKASATLQSEAFTLTLASASGTGSPMKIRLTGDPAGTSWLMVALPVRSLPPTLWPALLVLAGSLLVAAVLWARSHDSRRDPPLQALVPQDDYDNRHDREL